MRILITGYTSRMIGSKRVRGDYITFVYLLEDILREMGHFVERREVAIGEEIAYVYDYAFVGVAPLNSISAANVPQSHFVLDQLPGRCCLFADDWSFYAFGDSVRYGLKRWDTYLKYKQFPLGPEILEGTKESLRKLTSITIAGNNPPVLAPMFSWGDHEFLIRDNIVAKLHCIDPSLWVRFPTTTIWPKQTRKKQWVMAALSNHTKWIDRQGFKFPVYYVGNKTASNFVFLSESATIQLFAESYGILSVGYPSSGSGWWRTRYLNASWSETLVYCDPRDQAIFGEPYRGSPEHFESLRNTSLYKETIEAQRDWLEKRLMSRAEVFSILEGLLAK